VLADSGHRNEAIEQFNLTLRLKPGFKVAEMRLHELGGLPAAEAIIPPAFIPAQ
jgi:hypothetical protein